MGSLIQDIRYGYRMLLKRPAFTFVVVLTLAVGIGANTAIFSVVNAVLLRPLPYKDSSQLYTVLHDGWKPVAPANFFDWRNQNHVFESVAAAQVWGPSLSGADRPETVKALQLSANMFRLLGVNPTYGRTFNDGEDQPGNDHVVVLSDRLWQRKYGKDPKIVGQQITLDGESYTVVGVMPAQFQFAPFWATGAEMWAPLNLSARLQDRKGQSLRVFGRLKAGVTREQAQAEMDTISRRLEQQYPESNKGQTVSVDSLHDKAVGNSRPALLILLGAVGFVLLISCANVANLMMARATGRQREIAVRTALGASRGRVIRQMITESMMLALAGGSIGLLVAMWGIEGLLALGPSILPKTQTINVDLYVLLFTLGVSIGTGLLFGLAPALQTSKLDLNSALKEGGRGSTEGGNQGRLRRLLVVTEIALAMVLLIGGGLLLRSFARLQAVDAGFNPHNLLTMEVSFAGSNASTAPRQAAFLNELTQHVSALPGVRSASIVNHLPIGGDIWSMGFTIEGRPEPAPGENPSAVYRIARPAYFETIGATLKGGRDFTDLDNENAPGVVIINEAFARSQFRGENAIGHRITVTDGGMNPREIVGIVKDAKQGELASEPVPEMYLPQSQASKLRSATLVVRTSSDPLTLAGSVQNEVWAIDKGMPVSQVRSMDQVISDSIGPQRFNMLLLGIFAIVALILAVVGIYGVMSYSVSQRIHEIGVRMALGAGRRDVLGLVVGQGMRLALVGIAIGLVASFLLTRLMESLLFGVSATDPGTFVMIAATLGVVAFLSCYVPARRAARVDPMVALRHE
jgi:putative ABC transport system permease protein